MRKLAAGNWKMNGTRADLAEVEALLATHPALGCDMLLCPPATLIAAMAALTSGTRLSVGAQDCHAADGGTHTGDLSARQLADAGATAVIVGHSERRADHGETDDIVCAKAAAAIAAGLTAIICLGETEAERDAGTTLDVVARQLAASWPDTAGPATAVVAYEPVWAIGTGRTPTLPQITQVHAHLRAGLHALIGADATSVRLLYGGSVKPANASAIFALTDVDGALVGGASLKAEDFGAIVKALSEA